MPERAFKEFKPPPKTDLYSDTVLNCRLINKAIGIISAVLSAALLTPSEY